MMKTTINIRVLADTIYSFVGVLKYCIANLLSCNVTLSAIL